MPGAVSALSLDQKQGRGVFGKQGTKTHGLDYTLRGRDKLRLGAAEGNRGLLCRLPREQTALIEDCNAGEGALPVRRKRSVRTAAQSMLTLFGFTGFEVESLILSKKPKHFSPIRSTKAGLRVLHDAMSEIVCEMSGRVRCATHNSSPVNAWARRDKPA